jgi:hypothetical protein
VPFDETGEHCRGAETPLLAVVSGAVF